MSHVDYLCPACSKRVGVSKGGSSLSELDWVTCDNCKRSMRFHYLIRDNRMSILKGEAPRPPAPRFVGAATSISASETELRLVGVRLVPDSLLLIAIGSTWSAFDDVHVASFGATTVNDASPDLTVSGGPTFSKFQVHYVDPGPTQVDDVVISYLGAIPESKTLVVLSIQRVDPAEVTSGGLIDGTSPGQILTGTSFSDTGVALARLPEMVVCFHMTVGPSTDSRGTWASSLIQGTRAGTNAATPELNATIDYAHKLATDLNPQTVSKSGFTSREFVYTTPNVKMLP